MRLLIRFYNVPITEITPRSSGGIDDLFYQRKLFYLLDVDDDLKLEVDDIQQVMSRMDKNRDGKITYEEMTDDPEWMNFTQEQYSTHDLNGDGEFTTIDTDLRFNDVFSAEGNDISLKEYLGLPMVKAEVRGEPMKIDSFVWAERNFQVSDLNDSGSLSEYEYQAEFHVADANNNGFLEVNEIDAFRPTRHLANSQVCSLAELNSSGCDVNDVMILFDTSDIDADMSLTFEEYVRYFGELMDKA
ncbi:hypothetical protein SNE40_022994 [Patella caerulea]|uniref:EF-hand domain-containing protein n=1 Tax=Patella caerulea TaxID=87958 RepID=A0AAN8IY66_PATCE